MGTYITVDSGTTNTRVSLVSNGMVIETESFPIGARAGVDGNEKLKEKLKESVENLLSQSEKQVERIICSGMITSEFGLLNLPHIPAPAGIKELHDNMREKSFSEISDIPFVFIPGIKIMGNTFESTDMMRGEETELIGLTKGVCESNCTYVLPGSHSKIIKIDNNGRISSFLTALTGEMIFAMAGNTILKGSITLKNSSLNDEYLYKGYEYASENSINVALFKVRILKNIYSCTDSQAYSFFMGVILQPEISEIIKAEEEKVIIGGKKQIRKAMCLILKKFTSKKVEEADECAVSEASALGAVKIFEY